MFLFPKSCGVKLTSFKSIFSKPIDFNILSGINDSTKSKGDLPLSDFRLRLFMCDESKFKSF